MKKIKQFLIKLLQNENDEISSKRFLAIFIFTPVLILAIFWSYPINVLYLLAGLVTTLLGVTSVEKFSKNWRKNGRSKL